MIVFFLFSPNLELPPNKDNVINSGSSGCQCPGLKTPFIMCQDNWSSLKDLGTPFSQERDSEPWVPGCPDLSLLVSSWWVIPEHWPEKEGRRKCAGLLNHGPSASPPDQASRGPEDSEIVLTGCPRGHWSHPRSSLLWHSLQTCLFTTFYFHIRLFTFLSFLLYKLWLPSKTVQLPIPCT